jgi:tetratricopeptide (TPR) repeat protein
MKNWTLSLAALLLAFAAQAVAQVEDDGIPLAVTTLAHPSLRSTPTTAELAQSERYLASGLAFLKKDQPERAVEELKDSVRLAPRAENYKALGTAYYQAGKTWKAAWAYRESLQLKPDAKVQALVDSLEGKDHAEDRFATQYDELRYKKLVQAGKDDEKAGKRDTALRDYTEAFAVHNGAEARRPAFRLAAELTDDYLKAGAVVNAIKTMALVSPLRAGARDLDSSELVALRHLEGAETEVVKLTGARLREHQKAMLTDQQEWERRVQEKLAGRPGNVNLEIKR